MVYCLIKLLAKSALAVCYCYYYYYLGKLPKVLAKCLVDSNSKIAAAAIAICQSLGNALAVNCKQHVHTFFPGILQALGIVSPGSILLQYHALIMG